MAQLAPDSADTHLLAAYVLHAEARHEESDRAITRAISLAPHDDRPYFCGAQLDVMSGRVDYDTRRMARRAVELDPADADNHRLPGTVLLEGD